MEAKTFACSLLTLGAVAFATHWSLQDEHVVGVALRTPLSEGESRALAERLELRPSSVERVEQPNRVRLEIDPNTPAAKPNYRTDGGERSMPEWSTATDWLSTSSNTRAVAARTETGGAVLELALGDWCFGVSFRFEVDAASKAGDDVVTHGWWWSDLGPLIDESTGKPFRDFDYTVSGIRGVLRLANTRFEAGASIPFELDVEVDNGRREHYEARGVFTLP